MKLCWLHPTTRTEALAPLWAKLKASIRPCLRPDTEVEFRFMAQSGNFTRSLYAEHLNSVHMVEAALQAEEDGFDGAFLGCWNDPLWEAREVLSIPVASVSEQSMLAALTMGRRFAIVTVSEKTAAAIEMDLFAYGLRDRAIMRPVRSITPESDTDGTGVPVLDASMIGMKYLEAMTDIAKTCGHVKSRRHTFRAPDRDLLNKGRRSLGLIPA